jgi:Flp pilus assembly protein protease CpaA
MDCKRRWAIALETAFFVVCTTSRPRSSNRVQLSSMPLDDNKKLGTGLLVLGFIFLLLGVVLFFDAGLLAIGDVLFLSGITLTIGPRRTMVFFFKRKQLRGNVFFFGGIFLVLFRWAFVGMILQVKHAYKSALRYPTTQLYPLQLGHLVMGWVP